MNVLFDLDGTLTDPRQGIIGCIKYAMETVDQPISIDANLNQYIGPPLRDTFRALLASRADSRTIEAAVNAYRDRFKTTGMFENEVYEGIPQALESLSGRGARLFVATSKPKVFAQQILEHFNIAWTFESIFGSKLDGRLSDKGELIDHVLVKAGITSGETVMIGDRSHDMAGALQNGVRAIGVLWGYGSRQELSNAGATSLLEKPSEIEQVVI